MLCPECREPMSEEGMCDDCGCFYEKQEFIVTDLYNYNARPQRSYHRLDHFKEVLGQFQGREGKDISPLRFCTKSVVSSLFLQKQPQSTLRKPCDN